MSSFKKIPMYRSSFLPLASLSLITAITAALPIAPAQAQLANCAPPITGEYLLLVLTPTADVQARVYAVLPVSFKPTTCNYLSATVLRIGDFSSQETADNWATYIAQQATTSAFVARPPAPGQPSVLPPLPGSPAPTPGSSPLPTVTPTVTPSITPSITPTTGYNPQALGTGYAVLVNYYNRPETVSQVRSVVNDRDVGLVSYGQQPYLLAAFTSNQTAANDLLQKLTDKGLWAMTVDGRRVVLLKAPVK
jgi:hypothetical protein